VSLPIGDQSIEDVLAVPGFPLLKPIPGFLNVYPKTPMNVAGATELFFSLSLSLCPDDRPEKQPLPPFHPSPETYPWKFFKDPSQLGPFMP